jgi:GDPmannose 4,6-dehydratase
MRLGIITGLTGQDGSYLAELLLEKGYHIWGLVRPSSLNRFARIEATIKNPNCTVKYVDLQDTPSIQTVFSDLEKVQDTYERIEIYNLAAQSNVRTSFDLPEYTANVDGLGVLRFVEAIRRSPLKARIRFYQASTSELFGNHPSGPLNESSPFHPCSPYAVSKLFAYWTVRNYREGYGLFAVNGILFNHESPRRGAEFVTRKITLGLAKILNGEDECLYLGNLSASRDWGHARDFVEGMWRMLQVDKPEDFVLATGQSHTVREFVEGAFTLAGRPLEWRGEGLEQVGVEKRTGIVRVRVNPEYFRPNELHTLLGDSSKALSLLGWKHKTPFKILISEMAEIDIPQEHLIFKHALSGNGKDYFPYFPGWEIIGTNDQVNLNVIEYRMNDPILKAHYKAMQGQIHLESGLGKRLVTLMSAANGPKKWAETGTFNGSGSTQCLLEGLKQRADKEGVSIVSYEADPFMYSIASENLGENPFFSHLKLVKGRIPCSLPFYSYTDIPASEKNMHYQFYFEKEKVMYDTVEQISPGDDLEAVILDGGEYTSYFDWLGIKDMPSLKYIILDDINCFKNEKVFNLCNTSADWLLYEINKNERNGWAIFKKA